MLLSITIPALSNLVSSDLPDDLRLCPIRAFRCYLQHTHTLQKSQKLLFISHLEHVHREISPVSISRWMVKTIRFCYEKEGASLTSSVKAYSVRAVATSLTFFNQASLDQVVRAGTWVSPNTLISFYLKDVSLIQGDLVPNSTTGQCGGYYPVDVSSSLGEYDLPPSSRFFN